MPRRAPRPIHDFDPRTTPCTRCEWPLPTRKTALRSTNLICGSLPVTTRPESSADKWTREEEEGAAPRPRFLPAIRGNKGTGREKGGRTNQTGSDKWVGFNLRPINILALFSRLYSLSRPPRLSFHPPDVFRFFLPRFLPVYEHSSSPTYHTIPSLYVLVPIYIPSGPVTRHLPFEIAYNKIACT